ncbi:SPOR domain-containing protein [Catalinimonas alkaloidigena]|uniref:SPOR domain-containing protein n=1 Tax=Catalinimonas alkaloidigena TaxID=1075417 RepID=UPI0024064BE3|nr:SPOR domain-containing protein [Catalinimonas alkaloidigena]
MNRIFIFLTSLSFLGIGFTACSPSKTIGTQRDDVYNENIESLRIQYSDSLENSMGSADQINSSNPSPETPSLTASISTQYAINDSLNYFLDEVTDRNAENNSYQGYTVQVYTGNSREKANEAKNMVYGILPEASPTITFDPPNYKVKVGEFTDRLEAQPTYSSLKGNFPVVLIVPERFPINRED